MNNINNNIIEEVIREMEEEEQLSRQVEQYIQDLKNIHLINKNEDNIFLNLPFLKSNKEDEEEGEEEKYSKYSIRDIMEISVKYAEQNNIDKDILKQLYQQLIQQFNFDKETQQKIYLEKVIKREQRINSFGQNMFKYEPFGHMANGLHNPALKLPFMVASIYVHIIIALIIFALLLASKIKEHLDEKKKQQILKKYDQAIKSVRASIRKAEKMQQLEEQKKAIAEIFKTNPEKLNNININEVLSKYSNNNDFIKIINNNSEKNIKEFLEKYKDDPNIKNIFDIKTGNDIKLGTGTGNVKENERKRPEFGENVSLKVDFPKTEKPKQKESLNIVPTPAPALTLKF